MKKLFHSPGRYLLPALVCCLPLTQAAAAPTAPRYLLARAQPARVVTGRVVDGKGEALPGVTVLVKGTQNGTSTNANGEFSLDVPTGGTLVLSYVGFATQEVTPGADATPLAVTMQQDNKQLGEVVVLGYVSQDRQNLSSAVVPVDVAGAKRAPVATITEAIQGRTPGVNIQNSGAPGQAPNVVIRGNGSLYLGQ